MLHTIYQKLNSSTCSKDLSRNDVSSQYLGGSNFWAGMFLSKLVSKEGSLLP